MNWRRFGRKPNHGLMDALSWGLSKTTEDLKVAVVPAELKTEPLPNTNLDQTVRFKIVILYIIMLRFL
jgi:D-hexose-6-phosphate mutarotase